MKLINLTFYSLLLILLLFFHPVIGHSQTNVRVVSEKAQVTTEVNTASSFQITAKQGDLFEVIDTNDGWYQVQLFSGGKRFINSEKVEIVEKVTAYPRNITIRSNICTEAQKAQSLAIKKAMSKFENDIDQQGIYEKLLFDKYMIATFRKFDVSFTHYQKIMECIDDGLF